MDKITFENLPSTNTPINATNLNGMQDNIEESVVYQGATQPSTNEKVWLKYGKNLINLNSLVSANLNETTGELEYNTTRLSTDYILLKAGTYTISCNVSRFAYCIYNTDYSFNSFVSWNTFPNTITVSNDCYIRIEFVKDAQGSENISISDITYLQLELGNSATTYEPYINKEVLVKNTNNVFEEFYNESKLIKNYNGFGINSNLVFQQDFSAICTIIGNIVFLDIHCMAFTQALSHADTLIKNLPPAKNTTITGLYGMVSAMGDACRVAVTPEGILRIHYGSPNHYGSSSNDQYCGIIIYEKA